MFTGQYVSAEDRLLKPGEVAELFRVDPKTVTRWANQGRLSAVFTPGGHRRYREVEIRELMARLSTTATVPPGPRPRRTGDGG